MVSVKVGDGRWEVGPGGCLVGGCVCCYVARARWYLVGVWGDGIWKNRESEVVWSVGVRGI